MIWNIKVFTGWELRNNIEVSLNIESESWVELSFSWFRLIVLDIYKFPFLVDLTVLLFHNNVLVLIIKSSVNGNDLSS
jgi:hypothetical protein